MEDNFLYWQSCLSNLIVTTNPCEAGSLRYFYILHTRYSKYLLRVHSLQAQSRYRHQNSRVPIFPRQNVFVTGTTTPRYRHTKNRCACNELWRHTQCWRFGLLGGGIIVSDGDSGPFPTHNIFSTLKHGVASLPRRGDLYRKWSFLLVARSLKCMGLHLYLEL